MENMMEDSFIATVLPGCGGSSQVLFNGVEDFYVPGGDITCCYSFTRQFNPRHSDWIGIFKVGWETIKDYYTYMWVPVPSPEELTTQQEVLFKAYYLPKDGENYQFCYVDEDGKVQGASTPFQFCSKSEEDMLIVTTQEKVEEMEQHTAELLRENQELKESCASLHQQNTDVQAELQIEQGKVEEMEQRAEELLRENQELKENCASLHQQNTDVQAELQREQEKEEEMEQRTGKLLRENQQLQENCTSLLQQKSDAQAELQREQQKVREMEQHIEKLLRDNQELREHCTTWQNLSSRRQAELKKKQVQMQEKEKEMDHRTGKLLRENQQLQEMCALLRKQKSDVQAELQREQGKVEEMKERTKKLLRANQDLKAVILKRLKPNTDTQNTEQAELQGKKGKEEEMGQRIEKLLGENRHLKEMCALLRQQKSDTQAEQAQLAQKNKELIVENQATSDTMQHQRSKIDELLQRLAVQQKKVREMEQHFEKVLRENQQLKFRCASLPKPNSDEGTQAELQSEQKEPKSKLEKTEEEAKKRTVKKLSMAWAPPSTFLNLKYQKAQTTPLPTTTRKKKELSPGPGWE